MTFHDRQKCMQYKENPRGGTAERAESLAPGSAAPRHGVYQCGCAHRHQFLTTAGGDVLPPLDIDCSAASWRLVDADPGISEKVH